MMILRHGILTQKNLLVYVVTEMESSQCRMENFYHHLI